MRYPKQLNYSDQLCLFKLRGISGINLQLVDKKNYVTGEKKREEYKRQLHTVKMVGYYELKRYAYPFWNSSTKRYTNISFSDLVTRYYRDKKLRQNVLHAIEDIEVALNSQISYVLGNKYGPLGYLDFSKWCQRNSKNTYLKRKYMDKFAISKEQLQFLTQLQYKIKKSSMVDVQNYLNYSGKIFPPVWIMINVLTLGDSIHILKLMSKQNKIEISSVFECKPKELISWMECLNLIRNICCHNGNLIDFKLKTPPVIPDKYQDSLYSHTGTSNRTIYTNRIAIVICIILKLMKPINSKYQFARLKNSINSFIKNDALAQTYGFKNLQEFKKSFNK